MGYEVFMEQYNKIGYSKNGITQIKSFVTESDCDLFVNFLSKIDKSGNIYREEIQDSSIINILERYKGMVSE